MVRKALVSAVTAVIAVVLLGAEPVAADEHSAHHPAAGAPVGSAGAAAVPPASAVVPADAAGMPPTPVVGAPAASDKPGMAGGGMGDMMGKMMAPAPGAAGTGDTTMAPTSSGGCMGGGCGSGGGLNPIYPTLMTLPTLTPEKKAEIEALATQQMRDGRAGLATGSESLERATQAGDYAAMQQSVGTMRQGLDAIGAGISARRVLTEGKAPRNLALDWFKREMNLASPIAREERHTFLGVAPFHLFTMVLLIAFALAMIAMYFFKMRRTAALFKRVEPGPGSPPPGTAPPLPGLPSPPPGTPPVSGGAPPEEGPPASAQAVLAASVAAAPAPSVRATNWRGQLSVEKIIVETPSVKTLRFRSTSPDGSLPFTFVPGQFLNVAFAIGGARMNRSYSISSSPTQREYVELTVRREPRGAVSRHIDDLVQVGDFVEAGGPVGRFTFDGTEADSIVLIAGGVGITPMMSITRYLTERSWPGEIFFLYGCRAPSDFIFAKQIDSLQRANPKLHVAVTMSSPEGTDWMGPRGRITKEFLTQAVPDLALRRIHLCGPPSMMESTKALLNELGVPAAQVKTEMFGATKPAPTPAGTSSKPSAPATGPLVTFSKNNKSAKIHVDQTVLELSEELAIGIEFSCRVGTCGVCKVKMTSGEVEMAVEDALDADDKKNGIILACQAKPKVDVTVEA